MSLSLTVMPLRLQVPTVGSGVGGAALGRRPEVHLNDPYSVWRTSDGREIVFCTVNN